MWGVENQHFNQEGGGVELYQWAQPLEYQDENKRQMTRRNSLIDLERRDGAVDPGSLQSQSWNQGMERARSFGMLLLYIQSRLHSALGHWLWS